ncbi:MAG: GNAT family N-acetyltransferase [Bacillota bacterium]
MDVNSGAALFLLRRATTKDLHVIVGLKLKMFSDAGMLELLAEKSKSLVFETYNKLYYNGTAAHFIIETDNKTVACAGAFLKNDLPFCFYEKPVYGFIGDVYTAPEYRRRGYARILTGEAVNWLTAQGVDMIRLLATDQARPIYKELGFKESDEMVLMIKKEKG